MPSHTMPTKPPSLLDLPVELLALILELAAHHAANAISTIWGVCHAFRHCLQHHTMLREMDLAHILAHASPLSRYPDWNELNTPRTRSYDAYITNTFPTLPQRLPPNSISHLNIGFDTHPFPFNWQRTGLPRNIIEGWLKRNEGSLTSINAAETPLSYQTVVDIVNLPNLQKIDLSSVGIGSPHITDATLARLAQNTKIVTLKIAHADHLTDISLLAPLKNLKKLQIHHCEEDDARLTPHSLTKFLENHTATHLTHLSLAGSTAFNSNHLLPDIAAHTDHLTHLRLDGLHVPDEHVHHINQLTLLRVLDIAGTHGIAANLHLLQLTHLQRINLADIDDMAINDVVTFASKLRTALQNIDITRYSNDNLQTPHLLSLLGHPNNTHTVNLCHYQLSSDNPPTHHSRILIEHDVLSSAFEATRLVDPGITWPF